ncbi:adenylyltransferase/cytidyltransferase family protein [Saccharopolyspora sp. HNM0983]|uniref:Adenylyltransferase/cytidyltransferase family protein n=1 Tax=Saccharopolyspora montiporae TaxID=2781240 RepID=A0A929G231_9PSEU|nr:adenylyltransferase/cytidyltransferase family protein [Saccharopolyspora sp. HNM0983]MBE9375323.1 adenylyltransferase/cytidyltransferase family protein [Saccharopolyspora sp. HNM0983]
MDLELGWLAGPRTAGAVVTTGVFDLLHRGHVDFLRGLAGTGRPVLVGVESDERVRAGKGPGRPINPVADRAAVLAELRSVAAVFAISGPARISGAEDYARLLAPLAPAVLGFTEGDPHRAAKIRGADLLGAEVVELRLLPERSTSHLLARLRATGP